MKSTFEKEDIQAIAQAVMEMLRPHLISVKSEQETVFDVKGLATYLHVSVTWIYERSRLNEIPKTKPFGVLLFRKKDIDKWLDRYTTPAIKLPSVMPYRELD